MYGLAVRAEAMSFLWSSRRRAREFGKDWLALEVSC